MSRVLNPLDQSWYSELKAVSYYLESDLERVIREHLNSLFPDFFVFPFKKDITSRRTADTKKPDLAMVRRDFAHWGIIEVEVSEHDLRHVLEQTTVFIHGEYNAPDTAEYLKRQMETHCRKRVSLKRLTKLVSTQPPSVFVIVDAPVEPWMSQLKQIGVDVCIFQVYKNTKGRYVYRTWGAYPFTKAQEAHVRRHPSISNLLEIVGNFDFKNVRASKEVDIVFDAQLTNWALITHGGKNYLQFVGKVNPMSPNDSYCLIADKTNRYHLVKS